VNKTITELALRCADVIASDMGVSFPISGPVVIAIPRKLVGVAGFENVYRSGLKKKLTTLLKYKHTLIATYGFILVRYPGDTPSSNSPSCAFITH